MTAFEAIALGLGLVFCGFIIVLIFFAVGFSIAFVIKTLIDG